MTLYLHHRCASAPTCIHRRPERCTCSTIANHPAWPGPKLRQTLLTHQAAPPPDPWVSKDAAGSLAPNNERVHAPWLYMGCTAKEKGGCEEEAARSSNLPCCHARAVLCAIHSATTAPLLLLLLLAAPRQRERWRRRQRAMADLRRAPVSSETECSGENFSLRGGWNKPLDRLPHCYGGGKVLFLRKVLITCQADTNCLHTLQRRAADLGPEMGPPASCVIAGLSGAPVAYAQCAQHHLRRGGACTPCMGLGNITKPGQPRVHRKASAWAIHACMHDDVSALG